MEATQLEIKRSPAMIPVNNADEMILIRVRNAATYRKGSEQETERWINMSEEERQIHDAQTPTEMENRIKQNNDIREAFVNIK